MVIASRTPEGEPNACPLCHKPPPADPSGPPGDAPCPHCGHLLWFTSEDLGDALVIRPIVEYLQEIDWRGLPELTLPARVSRVVFDFEGMRFCSSEFLARLIRIQKKLAATGRKVKLVHIHPELMEVLEITCLDRLFDIEP